jgi:hypothetical protein
VIEHEFSETLAYLRKHLLVFRYQDLRTKHYGNVDDVLETFIDLLNKYLQERPCSDLKIVASHIGLGVVFCNLYKLFGSLFYKLKLLQVGDWIDEESKDDIDLFVSKILKIQFPFQAVIQNVDTFNENGLDFEIIDDLIGFVEESDEDKFEYGFRAFI